MVKGFYKGKSLDLFDGDFFLDPFYHEIQQEDKKRLAFGKSSFFLLRTFKAEVHDGNRIIQLVMLILIGKLCDTSTRFPWQISILDSHWSSSMDFVHVLGTDEVSLLHSCATKEQHTWAPKSAGDLEKKA